MNNFKYLLRRFSKNMTYRIIFCHGRKEVLDVFLCFSFAVADGLRMRLASLTEMSPGQVAPFAPNDDWW